jgi:hypothetical protein
MKNILYSITATIAILMVGITSVQAQGVFHTDSEVYTNQKVYMGGSKTDNGYDLTSFNSSATEKNLFIAFYGSKKSYVFPIKAGSNPLPFELTNILSYGVYSSSEKWDGESIRELDINLNFYGVSAKTEAQYYNEYNFMGSDETDRTSKNVIGSINDSISNKKSVLDHVSFTMDGSQFVQETSGLPFNNNVSDSRFISIKTDNQDTVIYTLKEEVNVQELIHIGSRYLTYTFFDLSGNVIGKVNPITDSTIVDIKKVKKIKINVRPVSEITAPKFYANHNIYQTEFLGTKADGSPLVVDTQIINNVSGLYSEPNSYTKLGEINPKTVVVIERGTDGWLQIEDDNGETKWIKDGYNINKMYVNSQTGLYNEPNSVVRISSIYPQMVNVIETKDDGWLKIKTWLGDKWIKNGYTTNIHYLSTPSGIYNSPNSTDRVSVVSTYILKVVERRSDGWIKINTWLGDKWMKDGYNETVQYVNVGKTSGLYQGANGVGYVVSIRASYLKVLDKAPNGWYLVPTYKGNLWVKDGYVTKSSKTYKVVRGDSLYGVARKTGVSVTKIKQMNKMKSNSLRVGQILKLN